MTRPLTPEVLGHMVHHLQAQANAKGGTKHVAAVNAAEVDLNMLHDSSSDSEDESARISVKKARK